MEHIFSRNRVFDSGSVCTASVAALSLSEGYPKVLRSDEQAIELELRVDDFQVETVDIEGQTYQRLIIPDMPHSTRQGEPLVPTHGTLVYSLAPKEFLWKSWMAVMRR